MKITRERLGKIAGRTLRALKDWQVMGVQDMRRLLGDRNNARRRYQEDPKGAVHLHYLKDPRTMDVTYTVEYEVPLSPPPLKFSVNKRRRRSRLTVRCQSKLGGYRAFGSSEQGNVEQSKDLGVSVKSLIEELGEISGVHDYHPARD